MNAPQSQPRPHAPHWGEHVAIFFAWGVHFLPLPALSVLGAVIGTLFYLFVPRHTGVIRLHLRLCFPQRGVFWREWVTWRNLAHTARAALEFGLCAYASPQRIARLVRIEGLEHLRAQEGRAVILLSAHFFGFDLAGLRLCQVTDNVLSMYGHLRGKLLEQKLVAARTRFGGQVIARARGLRPVLLALRHRRKLFYLPDHDFGLGDSLFAPFFGMDAATVSNIGRMAAAAGAAVLPCLTRREELAYVLRIGAPLAGFDGSDPLAEATRMNAIVEQGARENPEQYFWIHKRFKTRPPGAPSIYP